MLRGRQLGSLIIATCAAMVAFAAEPKPLVMLVSIDGLKPDAVTDADRHALRVPNLRALMADGIYATGVRGVLPSLTYPSHMTLMTGASPAKHGIYANTTFDPYNRNERGWYWYAEDGRVATLWDAAVAAGLTTANVYWPVSVGANVTWNLPQIWRTGTDDDLKLQRSLSTPGLERELSATLGRYPGGMAETVNDDAIRARFARRLIESKHPDFITVYFTGLDTEQHRSGPFSAPSNAALERIDALVGELRAAGAKEAPGRSTFCVVSDHGFAAVEHDLNLFVAFRDAGLFSMDTTGKITSWQAMPWPAGGMAAVMLADPSDAAIKRRVSDLLTRLAADPTSGIEQVLPHDAVVQSRGFPDAAFVVLLKIGHEAGLAYEPPLISPPTNRGMHGYSPELKEMHSSFFLVGPSLPKGRSVGEIDMRRIAPTLVKIMGGKLPDAELEPLPLD